MKPQNVGTELQLGPETRRRQRRPRLDEFGYRGKFAYHLVLTTKDRLPVFEDLTEGQVCVRQLVATAEVLRFELLAFCFMPDHLHILAEGKDDWSYLIAFVQRFKQTSSFHFKRRYGYQLWQQSFFDRVLRKDEDLATVAGYVFANPLHAGITDEPQHYPLSGGDLFRTVFSDGAKASSLQTFQAKAPGGLTRMLTDDQPA